MSNIRTALTRKLGPLPAWAWFLIGGVGLFIYRQRLSAAGSANDQAQVAASDGTTGYYGPYGQDNYPIDGGAGTGGGSNGGSGTTTGTTTTGGPPVINVNVPSGAPGTNKRTPKPKAQHRSKANNKPNAPNNKQPPRMQATTHNGRQHPQASGKYRDTSTHAKRARATNVNAKPKRVRKKR